MQHSAVLPVLDGARVVRKGVVRARQHGSFKLPCIGMGPWMKVYSNSLQNAVVGLYRRVLYKYNKDTDTYNPRTQPSDELVHSRLGVFVRRFTRGAFKSVRCGLGEYPSLYTGGKRKVYERAVESLSRDSIRHKDAIVKGFVKVESTKLGADPRLIQTRSPRFHAMLGTYLKKNEKALYYGVDAYFGEKTITKGLNADDIGQLMHEKFNGTPNCVAVGLDASRFDRSVSKPLLKFVHDIYRAHMGTDSTFEWLLKRQLSNIGRIYAYDGVVKYNVEAGVMSGDVDTSLKGCLIMCALVGSWLKHVGVKAKVLNNGDDCVVFLSRCDLSKFTKGLNEYFAQLGFDIVAEKPVDVLEKVEFCQSRPVVSSAGTYTMCRNPHVASVKDTICRLDVAKVVDMQAWAGSVSDCGLALAGDMPVFSAYYGLMARYSQDKRAEWMKHHSGYANGLLWLSKGMVRRHGVTDASRISFWQAWDILPHEQRAIEEYYAQVEIGKCFEGPIENYPQTSFHAPETLGYLSNGKTTKKSNTQCGEQRESDLQCSGAEVPNAAHDL